MLNRLLTISIIIFLLIVGYEAYYYYTLSSKSKVPASPAGGQSPKSINSTNTISPTQSEEQILDEIKKIAEKRENLPTCLQQELSKPGREDWLAVYDNRLEKKVVLIDKNGKISAKYDAKKCQYYEKK